MAKFYAVKIGKTPGIFTTWEECKNSVNGYSGAVYKSFVSKEEAEEYLGIKKCSDDISDLEPAKSCIAYVDGSYNKILQKYGCGVVLIFDKVGRNILTLSTGGYPPPDQNGWNINGEVNASIMAIKKAHELGYSEITIYHDYEGIGKWADQIWQANKEYTKEYRDIVGFYRKSMNIKFIHVKGHSGNKWNDMADELAKAGAEIIE